MPLHGPLRVRRRRAQTPLLPFFSETRQPTLTVFGGSPQVKALDGKKVVIVGCGAQGLNQGLNMRDSGIDVSYTLRQGAIDEKRQSFVDASENGFAVGAYEDMLPDADLVLNLTPDKQHTSVVNAVMPLMKQGSCLAYSHGFNIVEEGMQVRARPQGKGSASATNGSGSTRQRQRLPIFWCSQMPSRSHSSALPPPDDTC